MSRLKPRKELINLRDQFSQKNSISKFKQLYGSLFEEMNNYSTEEKLKGGEYQKMIREISTLYSIIDKYKPSYIEYTGGHNSSKDGILYFNEEKQYVEIVGMVEEQEQEAMSRVGNFSVMMPKPSLVELMKRTNWSENKARDYLKSCHIQPTSSVKKQIKNKNKEITMLEGQPNIPEDFLFERIVSVLKIKSQKKYKNFWLLIHYTPQFIMSYFGKEETRDFVLQEISSKKKDLVFSIKDIFNKIIFVPFHKWQENHLIFEWPL